MNSQAERFCFTSSKNHMAHLCLRATRQLSRLFIVAVTLAVTVMLSSCAPQLAGGTGSSNTSPNSLGSSTSSSTGLNSPTAPSRSTIGAPHDVALNWNPSISSGIFGYNVYRGTGPGGPYTKVNSQVIASTSYTDTAIQSGQTYYYVVTAMDSGSQESVYSNEVAAPIP